MMRNKEQILQQIDQLPTRYKYIIAITIVLLVSYIMYLLILAPYLNNYIAIKNELNAHRTLLNNKALRTQAINKLSDAQSEYESILKKINESFFTENEADLFIKTLPQVIRGFNNTIISLKPIRTHKNSIRHLLLLDWIKTLPKHEQGKSIDYIKTNQAKINAGVQKEHHIREISKRIINHNHEEVRRVWIQGKDDKFALQHMEYIELQLKMKGSYTGFLYVLQWLNGQGKLMPINNIYNRADKSNRNAIRSEVELGLYLIKELNP